MLKNKYSFFLCRYQFCFYVCQTKTNNMEIEYVNFVSHNGSHLLQYVVDRKYQSCMFDQSTLIETLLDSGHITKSDGNNVTIALLSKDDEPSEETYTLEEFLPMMSNTSWKEVATYIENSKQP